MAAERNIEDKRVAIVGLGYVGLPQALAFSNKLEVIGFDIDEKRVAQLKRGLLPEDLSDRRWQRESILFTGEEQELQRADFIIVTVPTPIKEDKSPDLDMVLDATRLIARNLRKGMTVIYESTVYPGVTEELCLPILEEVSGLKVQKDFRIGYSPERINPGDRDNRPEKIVKIVAGIDPETRKEISKLYGLILDKEPHQVSSIRVAEVAKLAENTQRDLNIAFMNELALICEKMDIDTNEIVDAMDTKWNALGFRPGLVGGHCISVDPHYYIYQAKKLGYGSSIITAGRQTNEYMASFIVEKAVKMLIESGLKVKGAKVYIFGLAFKENFSDIRNSKAVDIYNGLKDYGVDAIFVDPLVSRDSAEEAYSLSLESLDQVRDADAIILAVKHDVFKDIGCQSLAGMYRREGTNLPILLDVKGTFSREKEYQDKFFYWSL